MYAWSQRSASMDSMSTSAPRALPVSVEGRGFSEPAQRGLVPDAHTTSPNLGCLGGVCRKRPSSAACARACTDPSYRSPRSAMDERTCKGALTSSPSATSEGSASAAGRARASHGESSRINASPADRASATCTQGYWRTDSHCCRPSTAATSSGVVTAGTKRKRRATSVTSRRLSTIAAAMPQRFGTLTTV